MINKILIINMEITELNQACLSVDINAYIVLFLLCDFLNINGSNSRWVGIMEICGFHFQCYFQISFTSFPPACNKHMFHLE